MGLALLILELVIAFFLMITLYLQSGKVKNVGTAIIGTKDVELFENSKRRGIDKYLHVATIIMVFLFILIPIIYTAVFVVVAVPDGGTTIETFTMMNNIYNVRI